MSDPKSEPAGTGAQPDTAKGTDPADAPPTETEPAAENAPAADEAPATADDEPAAEDTVAANVDAPAQTPGTASAPAQTDAPTKADTPGEAVAGGSEEAAAAGTDQPTADDTVAANVDAPAEAPKESPAEDTTSAIPAQDASPDATRDMPPQADKEAGPDTPADASAGEAAAPAKKRRNPWPTVGTLVAVLVILAGIGYFGGLGPLNRLSTTRDLDPPERLAGLNRITDPATRERLQLDATRDALRRINDGKKATVEAYGEPAGDRLFMVIALRGKVNIDKEIRDSGATGDQVKKIGKSTCATSVQDIPTSCYRGSNTLTVIAQGLTDKADVNAVGAVADEAFDAMK